MFARATSACFGAELEGDQPAAGGQRPGQPDGAVAAEGADFEDAAGADHPRVDVQELALVRRHVDRRQTGRGVRRPGSIEGRVVRDQPIGEVVVDAHPVLVFHACPSLQESRHPASPVNLPQSIGGGHSEHGCSPRQAVSGRAEDSLDPGAACSVRRQHVARAAHRLQVARGLRVVLDLAAQPGDLDVDRALLRLGDAAAEVLDQLLAGDRLVRRGRRRCASASTSVAVSRIRSRPRQSSPRPMS